MHRLSSVEMLRPAAVLALLLVPAMRATAQRPAVIQARIDSAITRNAADESPFTLLARPSRFALGWPDGAMYEGDINVPVYLFSRTAALRSFLEQKAHRRWSKCFPWAKEPDTLPQLPNKRPMWIATGCTINFVPHFVIRQLSSESSPVQTPTFNPAFDYTWYKLSDHGQPNQQLPDIEGYSMLRAAHVRLGHYSNGQSGCLFANQAKQGNVCVADPAQPDTLNTSDGSFSTHYIESAFTWGGLGFSSNGYAKRVLFGTAGVRWYPSIGHGGMDKELADVYRRITGNGRVEARWMYRNRLAGERWEHREMFTATFEADWSEHRPTPYESWRTASELAFSLPGMYGFGVSWRYATGWDYYNIGFGHSAPKRGVLTIFLNHAQPVFLAQPWMPLSRR